MAEAKEWMTKDQTLGNTIAKDMEKEPQKKGLENLGETFRFSPIVILLCDSDRTTNFWLVMGLCKRDSFQVFNKYKPVNLFWPVQCR